MTNGPERHHPPQGLRHVGDKDSPATLELPQWNDENTQSFEHLRLGVTTTFTRGWPQACLAK